MKCLILLSISFSKKKHKLLDVSSKVAWLWKKLEGRINIFKCYSFKFWSVYLVEQSFGLQRLACFKWFYMLGSLPWSSLPSGVSLPLWSHGASSLSSQSGCSETSAATWDPLSILKCLPDSVGSIFLAQQMKMKIVRYSAFWHITCC